MANYLLLRNNKESGPHSLDDLMELGLKPYDLVWVQGKSAAWRYPSEVDELKPFAPVVEEQPFDRFYKKQTEEKRPETVRQEEQYVPQKQQVQVIAPEHEKYIPKKSVFVTMPGQKTTAVKPAIKEETYKAPVPDPIPVQQIISITENPVAAQVKYSQPLDEIKEMYVKTLQDRKQKIARKGFWLQSLKKAAVILFLVAIGLIAGFAIKSNGNNDKKEIAGNNMTAETSKAALIPSVDTPEINTQQQPQESKPIPQPNGGYVNAPVERVEEPVASRVLPKNDPVDNVKKETAQSLLKSNEPNSAAISPGVDMNPSTGERSRKVRTEGTRGSSTSNGNSTDVKSFKSNDHLAGVITVTSNEYKKVAFGGIRNLELTITNDSKYTLDKVLVELQYLKPSEQPLKTENIEFKSVGPKASSTVKIPDTNRGIKVVYRIINIKSREMDELASGN